MPVVEELYGQRLTKDGLDIGALRKAECPFMGSICDGGGNRDMARLRARDEGGIRPFFDDSVERETGGYLPCGICAVRAPKDDAVWAICPRRLIDFSIVGSGRHAAITNYVFRIAGFKAQDEVSVWREVSLKGSENGKTFNYRLDYVMRKNEAGAAPVIVEAMTCSTSGGNKSKGTDIQTAFRNAVVFAHSDHSNALQCPGVNTRQVWARMASQLIAKSEAANRWGGRTIWVVQDRLLEYIRNNTALPLDELLSQDWSPGEVNMLVSNLQEPIALYSGPIRPHGADGACWQDLLGAAYVPPLDSINQKLEEKEPMGTITVPRFS